jgi:3-hydroxyacyl-CoA dehydrogenase
MSEDDKKKMLTNISFNDKIASLNDVDFAIEVSLMT